MSPIAVGMIVFVCVFTGALVGMALQWVLPRTHLTEETKDVVKLGMGLVATMTALILGLVTASAKGAFDHHDNAIKTGAAGILQLDRTLAQYGPETAALRARLKELAAYRLALTWPEEAGGRETIPPDSPNMTITVEAMATAIHALTPTTDAQRSLQSRALDMAGRLQETRWQILGGMGSSVQTPFLGIVVFWLTMIFGSFGLFAPRNGTVVAVLFVCALSVAASMFLIVEMDDPYTGMMKVSSAPVRYALDHLGQ